MWSDLFCRFLAYKRGGKPGESANGVESECFTMERADPHVILFFTAYNVKEAVPGLVSCSHTFMREFVPGICRKSSRQ
jgi:hypothetical protein